MIVFQFAIELMISKIQMTDIEYDIFEYLVKLCIPAVHNET